MKSISGKKLCEVFEKLAWVLVRVKGSYHIYTKENVSKIIVITVHGNRDLPTGTLKNILKDAELTENNI